MVGMRAKVTLDVDTSKAKRSMDRAAAELNRSINGVGKKQISFNVNGKSFTQPLGRITASANEFTKSLEASNARVIAFGASVGIINGISEAFKALVVETVKFEKVLQDINVIVGASAGKLQEFGDGLFNVARNTAQAFSVSAEAALEFSRQGLTMEETLRRTNDALILTRLTGLDAADAVSGLTAAVNAFGDAGLSTTDIIDKLAAVDVKFAVSSEDLIKALERTGAVAIDAGVEIDSLIGLVTALQQTTARGGAVIGNGLKTIFTRIQRPESIRQLEEIGIAVKNLSGSILPADKIMINMAKSFDNLSQSQKSNIVQFSAGIFQANVFRAALRDLGKEQSIQAQATEIAGNAAGDAAQKNEMLNKTMAAMASQTSTSIQELAEILGTIGLAPDIDFFLSSIKDGIDGIKNTLGGGEDEGSTFAKGLVKGIGNVITGPAAIAFGAIFIKLFVNIAKFARTSLKDVLGIANEKDKIRAMEESILKALGENLKLQEGLSNLEDDRKAQEMFILGIIEKQNSAMAEQVNLAARLAKPLVKAGINPDFSKNEASGMIPVAASGMIPESSKKKERQGAAKGGYTAGAIDSMNVKGVGTVVYNKAEKVKQFPGMSQPAIMPPKESRAGKGYKDAFAGRHGFDPYASGGFVPNFERMQGSELVLDKSLTKLSANPGSAKATDEIKKSYIDLVARGQSVSVGATMPQLLDNTGKGHSEKVKNVLRFLQQEAGVASVSRQFDLEKLPFRGKKSDAAAEAAVLKKKGKDFFSTGGREGDPTFPVDLVGLGMRPIEVKSGQWKLPNVLMKSMRLYSDDGLMQVAKNFGASEELISDARGEKFKKGSKLLMKKKDADGKALLAKDSTDEEKHKSLLNYRLSQGLVPNFAGPRMARESDVDNWERATLFLNSKINTLSKPEEGMSMVQMKHELKEGIDFKTSDVTISKNILNRGDEGKGNSGTIAAQLEERALSNTGLAESLNNVRKAVENAKTGGAQITAQTGNAIRPQDVEWNQAKTINKSYPLSELIKSSKSLTNTMSPGAAYMGTKITERGANSSIKTILQEARISDMGQFLASEQGNEFGASMPILYPSLNKDVGNLKKGQALEKKDLLSNGVTTPIQFEHLNSIGKATHEKAPLDFINPDAESKFTHGGIGEKGGVTSGNFTFQDIVSKSLRSRIGNNPEFFKDAKSLKSAFSSQNFNTSVLMPAAEGLIPEGNSLQLDSGSFSEKDINKAVQAVYRRRTGKSAKKPTDIERYTSRYMSAIRDRQKSAGEVMSYADGKGLVNQEEIPFNDVSMYLNKHGPYIPLKEGETESMYKGLVPNFADLSKSKRLKSFQGEYEDLAKMGSPLASWALKTVKDKEFEMIGNGMESWAIGNEEVVYKLPRPMIDSFSKTGDLELKRWRKQMKVMAQPSLEYEVGPENKAWNLVPDSNIAKRAERIKSQLDSSGIDSLFLPNTEVLKVAGQDEFITSQERVKGSTFFNLQNEILKNPKNKSDFNLDGYKIVEHLMENIGESTMIRDVHSGNFIAEASKKKQLLSTVNQFAPVESKESKHLSGLGLRGLPDDSIAAIDFSSGLIPNFQKQYQRQILTDEETGTFLKYGSGSPGYANIETAHMGESGKKGGHHRNFNKLMDQYESVGSGFLAPQRAGYGPTSWAKLITMFPQLKNRIQPGLRTRGDFSIDGSEMGFRSLVGLKKMTKAWFNQYPDDINFLENFGKNEFFDEAVSFENLTTSRVKGEADGRAGFMNKGLVPNFAKTFYDFDETLATYPSSVTSADLFNAESASLAEPTDLAKSLKGRTLDILTARARESKPFISKKLNSWGINSGRIITTGSIQNGQTSAQKKATILQNMQKKNGGQYNLIDDAPENIAAIKALGNKNLMGQLYKFSGQHAGRGSGNAEGLIPNFSRVEQVQKSQKRRVKEQVTEEDKDLAHNIFDYLKTNISNLSSRFRFNRSTVSFGGNPEDYEKVFNHSSSRKNKENLIEIARSEMKMNRILKGFMIPHNEGVATARGKHKAPRDPFLDGAMHGGLVPNFADPLSAAISRERAAGVPQARIRVEKSSQLKSAQNPMGLAVTNTRDEPAGVQQGIRRAKTMGIDPKKHGASKGMVPNFAAPQIPDAILNNAKNELSEMSKAFTDSFSEFSKIASQFGREGKETLAQIASFDISKDFEGIKDLLNEKLERTESQINSITEKTGKLSKGDQTRLGELKKAKSSGEALLKSTEEKSQKSKAVKNLSSSGSEAQKAQLIKSENAMIKKMLTARGTDLKSLKEATKASQDFRIALDESAKSAEGSEDDGGGLQRLFYLQSAISLVNGQFETLAEGASGLTKTFAQGMLAISNVTASFIQQKELVSEGMNMAGVKRNESFSIGQAFNPEARAARRSAAAASDARSRGSGVGRMGGLMRNLSGVGRMFGRFLPVIGQLYTGFTVVNEAFKMFNIGEMFGLEKGSGVMDLLSSQGERAAKKLEKLGESTEKLQGALESLNSQTENREKVTDLEILGSRRTQKQELELQQLKLKGLDIDIKAQDALSGLLDENLVGTKVSKRFIEELSKGTNSNEDYVKVIERVIKAQKNQAAFLSGSKSFGDLIDKKLDKFNPDSDDIKLLQGASKVRGSQIGMGLSSAAAGGDDMDVKDRLSILNKNIAALERESSTVSFRSMSDVTKLTDRLAKNLQGTEDFDAEMMASQINSFIKNIDESIDNTTGLDPRETKAVNAGMKQMVIQLNNLKKNLEGESDRQQEAQLKKEYVTAYKNIIFNIEQFRKNEAHLTKLSLASLTHQNKLNSSQQSLLLEYNAIGKQAAISSDFARKRNAMEAKFSSDKKGVEMKTIESLNKLRDTYFNTDQLAQQFKKDGEEAADAVQALKENIKKGVTAADFAGIGKSMNLNPEVMAKVTEAFEQTSAETKNATSSLEVISSLLNKFGKATDSSTASALLLALHEKGLVTITDEHLNLLKSGLLDRKRQLELLNTSNKEAQQLLKLEEEHKLIKEKTVAGAAKLYNILKDRDHAETISLEAVKGEAATLAVINDYRKNEALALAKSVDVMELGFQKQVDKNRTEAISAVHSLRMLEAQTGSLKISNDSLIILEAKLKSETENAKLALQESQFRLEYLSDQSKRSELVGLQLAKERADLQTSNLLAAEKNLQLSSGKKLSELVGEQLNATLNSSRLEALTAAENALLLTGKTKQVKLIQEANELQEASNKLTELQNAVTKAGVSDKTLRMTTTADIGIEKANSILGTRTAGMKATVEPNAENMLAYANSLEQTNKLLGNGSRVMDRFRTKMAEINVEAENLGADLVDIGIDNARSGLKQMFDDIGSGAKSAKEAWSDFGLGLAKTLLDRMTQNNIDKIVKNLTFAFTGEEGKSDAEKIASETSNLVGVNNKIISSNLELISAIKGQTEALKSQIQSETLVNKPKTDLIPGSKPRSEDPLAAAKATAAKQEISRMLDEEENAYTKKLERLNKPKPGPLTALNRGLARTEEVSDATIPTKAFSDNRPLDIRQEENELLIKELKEKQSDFLPMPDQNTFHPYQDDRFNRAPSAGKLTEEYENNKKDKIRKEILIEKIEKSVIYQEGNKKKHLEGSDFDKDKFQAINQKLEKTKAALEKEKEQLKAITEEIKTHETTQATLNSRLEEALGIQKKITEEIKKQNTEKNLATLNQQTPATQVTVAANKFSGGKIQHFAKGGFVDGPAGVDKVPAMLTAGEYVVPKDKAKQFKQSGGEIQNFSIGGMAKELNNENSKNRAIRGAQGVTQLLVMNEVSRGMAKYLEKPKDDGPPTFDRNKFNNLDLRSDVNIKRGDPRLSARFLAKDPVMQEYKDYLLEKAAYDVEKKNQKVDKKMQTIGSVLSFMGSFAIGQMSEIIAPYVQKAVGWAKNKAINTAMGHSGLGKHSEAFKQARSDKLNVNYKDVSNHIESGEFLNINDKNYAFMPQPDGGNAWEKMNTGSTAKTHRDQGTGIEKNNASMLKRARGYQSGGSIPAMLTAGEAFVPAPVAKRIGYDNLNRMNTTGGLPIVQGKGGIDNVGPVGLTEGDFIIKKSSTDKLLRENPNMMRFALQNPEGFKRGEQGYYEGGVVGSPSTIPAPSVPKQAPTNRLKSADPVEMLNQSFNQKQEAAAAPQQKSEVTNNINVNVSIDQTGKETVSTENSNSSYEEEQQLSLKIKSAVLDVIRQEKRIGGELSS